MGCACSKSAVSENLINTPKTKKTTDASKKYQNSPAASEEDRLMPDDITTTKRHNNIISSFLNTFKKDKNKSKTFNDDISECTDGKPQTLDTNVTTIHGLVLKQTSPTTAQSVYSFSNLPLKTQCLLNSKKDFDQLLFTKENEEGQNGGVGKLLKAKEVKVYITEPQTRFKNQAHHYTSIFNSRNDVNYNNTQMSLYNYLETYAKKTNASSSSSSISTSHDDSFDLSFVDLHCSNSINENDVSLKNKYFRRMLSKRVLNELLNVKNSNSICRLPSNCIYVILLTNVNFESESEELDNLLLPDKIDFTDFIEYIKPSLGHETLNIFNKWYRRTGDYLELNINFLNFSNSAYENELENELQTLLEALILKLDESVQIKYIKSIQQEEIELILDRKIEDPTSIVWFHLIKTDTTSDKNDESTLSTLTSTIRSLNNKRYLKILDLLESQVLTHNYKNIEIDNNLEDEAIVQAKHSMNDFISESIKLLLDVFKSEFDKHSSSLITTECAFKLDKNLANEIFKHYQLYRILKNTKKSFESKYENSFNAYLNEDDNVSGKPIIFYTTDKDKNENTFNPNNNNTSLFISHLIQNLIKKNDNTSIIYRFCACTILSSEITTLLQSITQQLCYLVEVHESCSFNSPYKLAEIFCKLIEIYKSKTAKNQGEKILIILDKLDHIIKSSHDLEFLLNFLKNIFKSNTSSAHKHSTTAFKLILTFSSSFSTSNKNALNILKPIEAIFSNKHSIRFSITSETSEFLASSSTPIDTHVSIKKTINENVKRILFNSDGMSDNAKNHENILNLSLIVDILILMLNQTRYGLKESEIRDILRMHYNSSFSKSNHLLNYYISMSWYTLKYYFNLFNISTNSNTLTSSIENNQILYKLQQTSSFSLNASLNSKLNSLLCTYFQTGIDKKSGEEYLRALYEYPKHLNSSNTTTQHEAETKFLNNFIKNPKWLLNKSIKCKSALYIIHDIEMFKNLFIKSSNDIEEHGNNHDRDEFHQIEKLIYRHLYELYQNPNDLSSILGREISFSKQKNSNKLYENLKREFASYENFVPEFVCLNGKSLFGFGGSGSDTSNSTTESLKYCGDQEENILYKNVMFLSRLNILTLSETSREIRVWKINPKSFSCKVIRSMKFNKIPRDLRLLSSTLAVVLIDRNLHLIDLNKCEHFFDMNSTMNPNWPLFEVHDSQHVVLLARNRLTITLMKVALPSQNDIENEQDSNNEVTNTSATASSDDMFLFKVGEDRYLNSLMVSRNGHMMVCGDEVQKPFPLLVWNLLHRKLVYDLRQARHEFITSIQSIGSSGRFVVCACQEEGETKNCLIVYDLSTGQLFKKLKAKINYVCVELSEESNVIIAGLENANVFVYDLNTGSKRFSINSMHFPIDKIKFLDCGDGRLKNYFLTYDTKGYDWTIRLWDLSKGNMLISSFTCPSRISSCSLNVSPLYFNHKDDNDQFILVAVALYAVEELLIVKLLTSSSHSQQNNYEESTDDALFNELDIHNEIKIK